jgi:hypothetical protein
MPPRLRRRLRIAAVVLLLAAAATVLLVMPRGTIQSAIKVGDGLTTVWHDKTEQLEITAIGYRKRSIATVKVGALPLQQVRADDNGTVRLTITLGPAPGRAGTSVLVNGRGESVGSRTLIGGLPPAASARGASDLTPWFIAATLVLAALIVALARRPHRGTHRYLPRRRLTEPAA